MLALRTGIKTIQETYESIPRERGTATELNSYIEMIDIALGEEILIKEGIKLNARTPPRQIRSSLSSSPNEISGLLKPKFTPPRPTPPNHDQFRPRMSSSSSRESAAINIENQNRITEFFRTLNTPTQEIHRNMYDHVKHATPTLSINEFLEMDKTFDKDVEIYESEKEHDL